MPTRVCAVSFKGIKGIVHSVSVDAESLYEAAVTAMTAFSRDPALERIGPATVLDMEIREPATKHSISLQQVTRYLDGATSAHQIQDGCGTDW
ncbi:MAG: hypothetical protein ABL961_01820 [Vicinamibacterales bacterium]